MNKKTFAPLTKITRRKLRIAYSRKEKLEKLIGNLENFKAEKSISEDRHSALKEEYNSFLSQSESKIKEIKEDLKRKVEEKENEVEALSQNLENLETRFKIGELEHKDFQKSEQSTEKKIEKLKREIPELQTLINSKSSSDLGGYLDVKIEEGKGLSLSNLSEKVGLPAPDFDKTKGFFVRLFSSPKGVVIAVLIIILIAGGVIGIIMLKGNGLVGKYVNIDNKSEIIELYKDGTCYVQAYGMGLSGKYKVKGNKILFEADSMSGMSVITECERVRKGFDCESGDQYRKK